MVQAGDQPEVIPVGSGMFGQGQEVAADQVGYVALAFSLAVVAAMAFQRALGQVFAAGALGKEAGVVVVFQVR